MTSSATTEADSLDNLEKSLADASIAASVDDLSTSNIFFVSTIQECDAHCSKLLKESMLAIDLEGIHLGRTGEICVLQIGCLDGTVYLFDICSLQQRGFARKSPLRKLLEDPSITKLIFDCRSDCDALKYQYNVLPDGLFDLQVLFVLITQSRPRPGPQYLPGMKTVLKRTLIDDDMQRFDDIKTQGVSLFAPEKGGSYEVWKERPLSRQLMEYAAEDVKQLFLIYNRFRGTNNNLHQKVFRLTKQRVLRTITKESEPEHESGKAHPKALRDF